MSQLWRMSSTKVNKILGHVATAPPVGSFPVTNLYYDPVLSKMVGEYDDVGIAASSVVTNPPEGSFPVINIYYDPATSTFVGQYNDDTEVILEGGGHILLE